MSDEEKIALLLSLGFKKKLSDDKSCHWYEFKFKLDDFKCKAFWETNPEYSWIEIETFSGFDDNSSWDTIWKGDFKQFIKKVKQLAK